MMRRRFRRRSAKWTYADSGSLAVAPSGGSADFFWILPPGRAMFLMNTLQRDSLMFMGAHLWLDFFWKNTGGSTGLPDVDFGIFKTIQLADDTPDLTPISGQWKQPSTPSNITSWNEDDDDGSFGFLWSHHIKGSAPPNSVVNTSGINPPNNQNVGSNQPELIANGSADTPATVCRKFFVTQEWQPDVVVRSKRRIRKSEGIVLVMNVAAATVTATCNVHLRTLTK